MANDKLEPRIKKLFDLYVKELTEILDRVKGNTSYQLRFDDITIDHGQVIFRENEVVVKDESPKTVCYYTVMDRDTIEDWVCLAPNTTTSDQFFIEDQIRKNFTVWQRIT